MSAPDLEMGEKLLGEAQDRARMFSDILALVSEFIRRRDMAERLNANMHDYTHHAIETATRMRNRAEQALNSWIAENFATARRVAEMEGEAHRREAVIAGLRAQLEADCEGGHPHD